MLGIDVQELLRILSRAAVPGLLAITLHEVAHGWAAKQLGDPTAQMLGRLTINPLKHVDLLGTVLVPLAMLLFAPPGLLFGWAKPVPVTTENLRSRKRDMAIVAIAGPASNLLMAVVWSLLAKFVIVAFGTTGSVVDWALGACVFGMWINTVLAVVNLLPVPPLDGGRILVALLPARVSDAVERIEPFGIIIVILLMVSGVLGSLVEGPRDSLLAVYHSVAGLA
ncbi:MAG TPA: site-2 protease family protein [Thermoanaerobaculia bacterium]|jgi:Zn-dependent protease|nr:site-2 protease family protein [Thermoanaerobaculia bacterium]